MGADAYERVFALFSEARALAAGEREAFLALATTGEPALRAEVESLLAHDAPDEDAVGDPAARAVAAAAAGVVAARGARPGEGGPAAPLPGRIGRYRIVRKIAEGGMGVVYEARQEQPARTVALKVVRPDMATRDSLRRLEHEAEALAQFSHAGIAQIYEAGTHDAGFGPQPFFAMELVRGMRLDEWVRSRAPDPRARLALLAEVAEAVHHAHQRGVVHRDLKPGNVLVQEDGRPKVLDFGIARLASGEGAGGTLATQAGQVLGTLPYMSPEQLAGRSREVDTRTDVYSLGVILYEMLAGRLPIDVTTESLASAARRVCEESPPPLGRVDPRWRGDVETIVAKALAKDREERYASAQALADDLRRHLADEPIEARSPSAVYVLAKFARRHKALTAVLVALAATLTASAVGGAWLASREGEARRLADQRAREADQERDEARRLAYRGALTSAAASLSQPDVARAKAALEGAPPEERGWEWRYLEARLDDALEVVEALPGRLYGQVRLHEGALVIVDYAFGGIEGQVIRRDLGARVGPERDRFDPHGVYPALSPTGAYLSIETGEGIRIVDTATRVAGAPVTAIPGTGYFGAVAEDGRHAWVISRLFTGPAIRVGAWPAAWLEGAQERTADWSLPGGDGLALAATSDCSTLLLASASGTVWVLKRAPDGTALPAVARTLHAAPVAGVALDATGTTAASCATDSSFQVWDVPTGEVRLRGQGRPDEVRGIGFSADALRLATWGPDGSVRVRDAGSGQAIATLLGHRGAVAEVYFTRDGARLVSRGDDGTVRLWDASASDAQDFACLGHRSYVYEARFSPDGARLATIAWDGSVRLWDPASGRETARHEASGGGAGYTVAWSLDGGRLLVVGAQGGIAAVARVLDVATGVETVLASPCRSSRAAAWSPSGDLLVVPLDGSLLLLDGTTYAERDRLATPSPEAVAFSADGSLLAVGGDEAGIEVWDVRRRERLHVLTGHTKRLRCLAFHPQGAYLASASWDGTIRTWDARAGTQLRTLTWHRGRAHALAFSPDGSRLFTGADDGRLAIWDAQRLDLLLSLPAHGSYVHGIDTSPDGSTVVTCSGDATVRLWSLSSRGSFHRARAAARPHGR